MAMLGYCTFTCVSKLTLLFTLFLTLESDVILIISHVTIPWTSMATVKPSKALHGTIDLQDVIVPRGITQDVTKSLKPQVATFFGSSWHSIGCSCLHKGRTRVTSALQGGQGSCPQLEAQLCCSAAHFLSQVFLHLL